MIRNFKLVAQIDRGVCIPHLIDHSRDEGAVGATCAAFIANSVLTGDPVGDVGRWIDSPPGDADLVVDGSIGDDDLNPGVFSDQSGVGGESREARIAAILGKIDRRVIGPGVHCNLDGCCRVRPKRQDERCLDIRIELHLTELIQDFTGPVWEKLIAHPSHCGQPFVIPGEGEQPVLLEPCLDAPAGRFRNDRTEDGINVAVPGFPQRAGSQSPAEEAVLSQAVCKEELEFGKPAQSIINHPG